jgi:hypothetical protein
MEQGATEGGARGRQRCIEEAEIAQPSRASVPIDLVRVQGEHLVEREKCRLLHSASLLNAPA